LADPTIALHIFTLGPPEVRLGEPGAGQTVERPQAADRSQGADEHRNSEQLETNEHLPSG